MTEEERAEEAEMNAVMHRMDSIRHAIETALGGAWHRKKNRTGGAGTIACPCCGATVSYRRAETNGHIAARCSTAGCANWME